MVLAIIFGVLAAAAVIAVLIAVYMAHSNGDSRVPTKKKSVSSIDSLGVSTSLPGGNGGANATHVKTDRTDAGDITPSLKNRFTAVGVFAAAVFSVLGFKAFQTQVLKGQSFTSKSDENSYATVSTPAPRGYIYDRDGTILVRNRSSLTVLAESSVADDNDVVARLSAVLGVPRNIVRARISDSSAGAQSQRVVAKDVRMRDVAFITEHSDAFSGVTVETRTVREYPYGALGSHAIGYVGTVSEEELANVPTGRDLESGDDIGKSGIEAQYDSLLAGEHGQRTVLTDAEGNVRKVISETQPSKGSDVYLTISAPVQYAADMALKNLVAPSGDIGTGIGVASALVCIDVRDGSILAMSSYPTYSPETFVGGISDEVWQLYNTEESHYPLINRAIAGTYPAASTYKAFTSLAGLEYGFADDKSTWNCTGSWDGFNSGDVQNCWNLTGHGTLDLRGGIVNSCDVVFYEIAKDFFNASVTRGGSLSETAMQEVIARFNYGEKTGVDLAGEAAGRIPTPKWKAEYFEDVPEEAQWRGGDMTNMVIGQGYVLVTPIQQAAAYSAVATGKMYRPHLLKEVRNSQGKTVVSYEPEVVVEPQIKQEYFEYVRDALHGVAQENSVYAGYFAENGVDGACKTGTAEVAGKNDYGWLCCYGPYDDPKYAVACVCEESGNDGQYVVEAAVEVLAAALNYEAGEAGEVGPVAASSGVTVAATETTETTSSGRGD